MHWLSLSKFLYLYLEAKFLIHDFFELSMKDYYSTLGIDRQANAQTIEEAYKKLSLKFNPELNDNDPFFINHYQALQEAYRVLGNDYTRQAYDKRLEAHSPQRGKPPSPISTSKPIIQVFDVSATHIHPNEPVTFTWNVVHADRIYIDILGNVPRSGIKTTRIEGLNGQSHSSITIEAENTYAHKKTDKYITIYNKAYFTPSNTVAPPTRRHQNTKEKVEGISVKSTPKEKKLKAPRSPIQGSRMSDSLALVIGGFILIIVVILIYQVIQINQAF